MEIKVNTLVTEGIIYMYLTVFIFFAGWLKPAYAIAICIAVCLGLYRGIHAWYGEENDKIYISGKLLFIGAIVILFMCWNTGIGAFAGQTGDWHKHNAILHDLIEKEWPVIYRTEYGDSMLSYYIGFYLIPSVVGKITDSFRAAEITQYMMAAAGLYIIWLMVIGVCRTEDGKMQMVCLGMIFLFGGMLALGQTVCGNLYPENFSYGSHEWMNPETVRIQYSSNWSLLKWVPGQTIVPWIAVTMLLLKPDKIETYVMIGLPVILCSGFAMIGIVAMMIALCVYYKVRGMSGRVFSLSNVILGMTAGSVLVLYFLGNITGEKPEYLSFHLLDYGQKKLFYFLFCFFMFGYYAILLFKENRKNIIYWVTVIALCTYPLFSMGVYNDFTMRASIPALFSLMIIVLKFLFRSEEEERKDRNVMIRKTLLAAGLTVGMLYPLLNIREGIVKNRIGEIYRQDAYMTMEQYADLTDEEIMDDLKYNYYSYHLEKDLFYQYLAK